MRLRKSLPAAILITTALLCAQTPVSTANAEHYKWGDNCDGWYLLKTDAMHIIQERMPAGTAEVLHRHAKARQFFLILKGTAVLDHDGKSTILHAGEGFEVPPGTAHRVKNETKAALDLVVTSQPPSHNDREDIK